MMRKNQSIIKKTGVSRQTKQMFQRPALMLLSGKWNALLYYYDGETLSLADMVSVFPHQYADDEGFFMRLAFGKVYGRGSVKERPDHETHRRFLDEVSGMWREAKERFSDVRAVYAVLPAYRMHDILDRIGQPRQEGAVFVQRGNMLHLHPRESADRLARAMSLEQDDGVVPMSPEAKKLLERTDAIRRAPTKLPK